MTSAVLARCDEMRFLVCPGKQEIARRIESKFLAHHFLKIDVKTIKRESSLARHDE
jgi:hypothetical protein